MNVVSLRKAAGFLAPVSLRGIPSILNKGSDDQELPFVDLDKDLYQAPQRPQSCIPSSRHKTQRLTNSSSPRCGHSLH